MAVECYSKENILFYVIVKMTSVEHDNVTDLYDIYIYILYLYNWNCEGNEMWNLRHVFSLLSIIFCIFFFFF